MPGSCGGCRSAAFGVREAVVEAPGLGAGVDDVGAVGESVDDGLGEAGVGEHLRPFAEGQVGGDDQRGRSLRSEMSWKTSSVAPSGSAT